MGFKDYIEGRIKGYRERIGYLDSKISSIDNAEKIALQNFSRLGTGIVFDDMNGSLNVANDQRTFYRIRKNLINIKISLLEKVLSIGYKL